MDNLMHVSHLLATDVQFRKACTANPAEAMAQRGITLTDVEHKALERVQALLGTAGPENPQPDIDIPDREWFLSQSLTMPPNALPEVI